MAYNVHAFLDNISFNCRFVSSQQIVLCVVHLRCIRFITATCTIADPGIDVLTLENRDGRIKLFGAPGIEVLLQSPLRAPCKYLEVSFCVILNSCISRAKIMAY